MDTLTCQLLAVSDQASLHTPQHHPRSSLAHFDLGSTNMATTGAATLSFTIECCRDKRFCKAGLKVSFPAAKTHGIFELDFGLLLELMSLANTSL